MHYLGSQQTNRCDSDAAAEADVHVSSRRAIAELVIAGVIEAGLFVVPIIEGQRLRIERTPDHGGFVGSGRKDRQIHVVEQSRLDPKPLPLNYRHDEETGLYH